MHKLIMGDGIYYHKNDIKNDNRKSNLIPARGYRNNGKIKYNGYIAIYMPEHHRAFDNGCVYEHILVAEKMLGRELLPEECVHHKDKDRTNNSEDNLMVFATNEDHIAFHAGGEAILQENGSYKTDIKLQYSYEYINMCNDDENKESIRIYNKSINKNKILCPICNENYIKKESKMCRDCYNKLRKRVKIENSNSKKDLCPICNKNLKSINAKMCLECRNKENSKNIPPKEKLEKLIYEYPFTKIGEMFSVTDNAVRKWCKKYELPYRKKDINNN